MEAKSTYMIKDDGKENYILLIVTDEDPGGVTIEISNGITIESFNYNLGTQPLKFNMPRKPMIEALEYIVKKLKSTAS